MSQLRHFLQASARREAEHDARHLSLMALATRGDPRQMDKTLDRLNDLAEL